MLSQLASRLNAQRLRMEKLGISSNEDSSLINKKNRFPRFKSPLRFKNFAGNHAGNQELPSEHHEVGDQINNREPRPLNSQRISSLINVANRMHIRTEQDVDIRPIATSSSVTGNESSETLQSISGHNIKAQRTEHEKNTLKRIFNIKNQFPRFRSPFRIRSSTCTIASHEKSFSDQKSCTNKNDEEETYIKDLKTLKSFKIEDKLVFGVAQCGDSISASSSSNTIANKGTIKNKKAIIYCKKSLNQKSVIVCGDSKIENACTKNQFKCNIHATNNGENITNQIDKQNTLVIRSATTTSPRSCSKLGFISRTSGATTYTSYIAMLNTELNELEDIKRITVRRFRGLEQQFNCKIILSSKPSKMRARTVYKFEIQGPTFREVAKCRNALPKCITEKLITKAEINREMFLGDPRRD
ncbi:unnamed protein product [Hymenolepis diminuta]|uniref:Uncharacterized protein n=1 Tax=Hymenolepis diminuta TaxID=6216 RepID=A0A564Y9A9_HYMDI|nr:unnamed protein product [Hymenolepis diminuta]